MGVYIWKEGTPTSYDIEDLLASDPYSMQRPSGNLGKITVNYEFVDSQHGTCDIMINGESGGYGSIMLHGGYGDVCGIRLYNGTDVRIQLGEEYQSRTIVSHSGTVVLDLDGKKYSFNSIVVLDGDESVPLQSSGALTGDSLGAIRNLNISINYATITGTITVNTGGGEKPLLSAHIGEPMYESYIIPDLSQEYSGSIPAGASFDSLQFIFNVTSSEFFGEGAIADGNFSLNTYSVQLPGGISFYDLNAGNLQGTVTYNFNNNIATYNLSNGSGGSKIGSGEFSRSLDSSYDIPIAWTPQPWGGTATGTIEIRVER